MRCDGVRSTPSSRGLVLALVLAFLVHPSGARARARARGAALSSKSESSLLRLRLSSTRCRNPAGVTRRNGRRSGVAAAATAAAAPGPRRGVDKAPRPRQVAGAASTCLHCAVGRRNGSRGNLTPRHQLQRDARRLEVALPRKSTPGSRHGATRPRPCDDDDDDTRLTPIVTVRTWRVARLGKQSASRSCRPS